MSVLLHNRKLTSEGVALKARTHLLYVLQITSNKNKFDPELDPNNVIVNQIIDLSIRLFLTLKRITRIKIRRKANTYKQLIAKRNELYRQANNDCDDLLALIEVAQKQFHFAMKRFEFWSKMVIDIQDSLPFK